MTPQQEHPMPSPHSRSHRSMAQQGLSLIVVLLALVTLAFASVALIRSIDTGSLVMGNLSFKKTATTSSDQASDTAITWIQSHLTGVTLYTDSAANGYSATSLNNLDLTGNSASNTRPQIDWAKNKCGDCVGKTCSACIAPSDAINTDDGFTHRYLIARMCFCEGDPNGTCAGTTTSNTCSYPLGTAAGASPKKDTPDYAEPIPLTGTGTPYFRIIVRTEGPRNTATVTETYVHF